MRSFYMSVIVVAFIVTLSTVSFAGSENSNSESSSRLQEEVLLALLSFAKGFDLPEDSTHLQHGEYKNARIEARGVLWQIYLKEVAHYEIHGEYLACSSRDDFRDMGVWFPFNHQYEYSINLWYNDNGVDYGFAAHARRNLDADTAVDDWVIFADGTISGFYDDVTNQICAPPSIPPPPDSIQTSSPR